ncbi:MAG: B12-binding domain-containing radical SAM protein [Candidatus Desulforudis sp.]|nr:B12-binding domain-containing radical SAM protein [Desulforudis sp.]
MKVILVAPAWRQCLWEDPKPLFPPLNLGIVAALTPPGIEVRIVDESVTPVDFEAGADLVGITAMTALAPRAYAIADAFRARGVPVVLGGMHPSAVPEEALEHADAVVVGEAEGLWPELLADFQAGRMRPVYRATQSRPLTGLPQPRRDLWDPAKYLVPNTVQTTRGCPFACNFCAVSNFFGRTFRHRPVDEVVQEVSSLPGRLVGFVDDNIIASGRYARELFRALIPLRIQWFSQGSLNLADDEELLGLAAQSGCVGMFIGLESLTQSNLDRIGKRVNHVERFQKAIDKIHRFGIAIEGAFIFGLDNDDAGVFRRTVNFARRCRLEAAQFSILTPLPGTPLYREMQEQNRITDRDWSRYNFAQVVYTPLTIPAEKLQQGFNWAWHKFYSYPSILRRLGWRPRRHRGILWALNLSFRRRVQKYV